jgi:hypothetical protein
MRKLRFILLFITIITPSIWASKPAAAIIKLKNQVTCQTPENPAWAQAKKGQLLTIGHKVKTGDKSLAMIKFLDDNSLVRMKPKSLLSVGGKAETGDKKIKVDMGSILFNIKKRVKKGSFAVETPTSVATVKGTVFWMVVREDGTNLLVVLEGAMELKNKKTGEVQKVKAGYTGIVQGVSLRVRYTEPDDIPEDEKSGHLRFQFKDADNNLHDLEIEFEEIQ